MFTVTATAGQGGSIAPAEARVSAGGTASFALAPANGFEIAVVTGCNGQLSGGTYVTGPISADCGVVATFRAVTGAQPVTYQSFNNATLSLFAWPGRNVALLTDRPDLDRATMDAWLDGLDRAYDYYAATAPRLPTPNRQVNGRLSIARVPATCGAGCGLLGATGIEGLDSFWDGWYASLRDRRLFDQALFYELGRNFWFYSLKIAYRAPDSPDTVITGFAVLMRFEAMAAAGVAGADFNGRPFAQFRSEVEALVDAYEANPAYRWDNTLRVNQGLPGPYGATDLFASFVLRLKRDQGGEPFIRALWREVDRRPDATTTQDAVDNFILAASAASQRNLTRIFTDRWRWPISDAARREAEQRFGLPV